MMKTRCFFFLLFSLFLGFCSSVVRSNVSSSSDEETHWKPLLDDNSHIWINSSASKELLETIGMWKDVLRENSSDDTWKPVLEIKLPRLPKSYQETKIGCDRIVGSGLSMDQCGICGGDGQSCHHVIGLFRRHNLNNDFHKITRIPSGATRINITESQNTRSYLALRAAGNDGVFYINGELKRGIPDPTRSYSVAGTFFEYERPYQSTKGETILADGPTTEDLDLMIYYQGANPGIFYEYILPKPSPSPVPTSEDVPDVDSTRHGLLDRASDSEGDLERPDLHSDSDRVFKTPIPPIRRVRPINARFYHHSNRFMGHSFRVPPLEFPQQLEGKNRMLTKARRYRYWGRSNGSPKSRVIAYDPDEESTNTRREAVQVNRQLPGIIGKTTWRARGYGPCSKSCADGIRRTIMRCIRVNNNQVVDESYCTGPRPRVRTRKCNRQPCPAYYDVGKWSECSRTCGIGRRTRVVVCKQHFPGNFTATVTHRRCRSLPRRSTHEKCKLQDCSHWEASREWSKCNVRCGSGTQVRRAVCKAGNGETLPDDRCSAARRPSNVRPCDAGPCVTRWYVTNWEECSADCDRGLQRRHVYCLNTAGSIAGCASRFEPNATRTCARSSCGVKYEWFAGNWEACSSKCGSGVQNRKVTCLSVQPDGGMSVVASIDGESPCDESEKPATQQQCNTQSCGSRWHYTRWSECSVSCGGGSRSRDVQCLDAAGSYSSLCNIEERPMEAERCNTIDCLALRNPNCEDRLHHCDIVLQARLCSYAYYRKMCCYTCSLPRITVRSARLP